MIEFPGADISEEDNTPSVADEASTPFSPNQLSFGNIDTGSSGPQWPLSSCPFSPAHHGTGFAPFSGQPIHLNSPISLYNGPTAVTWAATACSVAQSSLSPPTVLGSSISSSPPNSAAQLFDPAVPNFNSVTQDISQVGMIKGADIMDPSPSGAVQGAANSSTTSSDSDPPPAKKPRTRTPKTGKTTPGSSKPKKMSSPKQKTTPPKGGDSSHPRPETQSASSQQPQSPEDEQARLRDWHNCIGKKYRNKLNEQFEFLQAALIPDPGDAGEKNSRAEGADEDAEGEGEGSAEGEGTGKRRGLNKAKLLDMARERIEKLTMENERLEREQRELKEGVSAKEMELKRAGGGRRYGGMQKGVRGRGSG
ncbi:hypothetical protein B0T14DRAFT_588435 [Immersiella caudata]|uniref:BHLH domain-containing protein n=1 Tax=Immersiella caudata TaxID=314043 RepID=A0AA39WJA3_9PEZI|nr:hypothetical protein B0T14DRAFT_588435 [Immersiella caudata]